MTENDSTEKTEGQKFREALGKNIKHIRESRNIERAALEQVLQIKSSGGLTQIEKGGKGLPPWKIDKLEVFLKLPKGTLMKTKEYTDEELEVMTGVMIAMEEKGSTWELIKHLIKPLSRKDKPEPPAQ